MTTIVSLITEALDAGYDVKIITRRRDDPGEEGQLFLPTPWARRLGFLTPKKDELLYLATPTDILK